MLYMGRCTSFKNSRHLNLIKEKMHINVYLNFMHLIEMQNWGFLKKSFYYLVSFNFLGALITSHDVLLLSSVHFSSMRT